MIWKGNITPATSIWLSLEQTGVSAPAVCGKIQQVPPSWQRNSGAGETFVRLGTGWEKLAQLRFKLKFLDHDQIKFR